MGARHIHWTEEWDAYLRRKYPRNSNEKCLAGLKRKGYCGSVWTMVNHARRDLLLCKSEEFLKQQRLECIAVCLEKRGDDFPERQRQRALSGNWWGGNHHNGPSLSTEQLAANAKRYLDRHEVKERARQKRKITVRRDLRRRAIGLDPITNIHNLGDKMTREQKNIRYQMKYECGYLTFPFDKRIYYDAGTRRSSQRERTAESRGCYVYHVSEREKFKNEQ